MLTPPWCENSVPASRRNRDLADSDGERLHAVLEAYACWPGTGRITVRA